MYFKKQKIFIVVFMMIFTFTGCVNVRTSSEEELNESTAIQIEPTTKQNLTKQQALEIEEQFISGVLKQETIEQTTEVKNYKSKQDLIEALSKVADVKVATAFVEEFYTEESNKLYVIPQGGPAKILADSPYEFSQIDENTYQIVQSEEDLLRGAYTLSVEFKNIDNKWKISKRVTELKE